MEKKPEIAGERRIEIESPIGLIVVEGFPSSIYRVRLPGETISTDRSVTPLQVGEPYPALEAGREWFLGYFAGKKTAWEGPLPGTFTAFEDKVYRALLRVPFGATVSYGELAAMAGRPGAARAVGRAMAANPLSIMIPCHRVLGSDGSLHGYGGGLPMKEALLRHEGASLR